MYVVMPGRRAGGSVAVSEECIEQCHAAATAADAADAIDCDST